MKPPQQIRRLGLDQDSGLNQCGHMYDFRAPLTLLLLCSGTAATPAPVARPALLATPAPTRSAAPAPVPADSIRRDLGLWFNPICEPPQQIRRSRVGYRGGLGLQGCLQYGCTVQAEG